MASDVGTDGSFNPTAITETSVTLTINKWKQASVDITDKELTQSAYDLMKEYSMKIGYALGYAVEDALLAEWANVTNTTTNVTDLDDPTLTRADQFLNDADAPKVDRFFITRPSQERAIKLIDKFVNLISGLNHTAMYKDQLPGGGGMPGPTAVKTGVIGELYGYPVLVNTRVVQSGGQTKSMLWQREGFALAMQNKVRVEFMARTKLSRTVVGHELFGETIARNNHVVVTPSTN